MLTLKEEHRKLFQEPFGELHSSIDEIRSLIAGKTIYAVGDVVTHNLQKAGIIPAITVVDGFTMRSPCSRMPELPVNCLRVKNPAGSITDELVRALEKAIRNTPSTIFVDGEEDLAVIPLVLAAPEGSIVLYGQPNEGVVLRVVNREAKETAQRLLNHFVRVG
jgi:hypothetical protein